MLALGREFHRHGCDVTFATHPDYQDKVEAESLRYARLGQRIDELPKDVWENATTSKHSIRFIINEFVVPNLRTQYEQLEACGDFDLAVVHPLAIALPMIAEKRKKPWVSTSLSPLTIQSAEDASIQQGLPFNIGALQPMSPKMFRLLIRLATWQIDQWLKPAYELRKELGLPRGKNPLVQGQFSPYATLVLFSELMQKPQTDWPKNSYQLGFPLYRVPGARLSEEIEDKLAKHPDPIVFTMGTAAINARREFFDEIITELNRRGRPALFASNEPYHLLFPRASVIVHSCGIGTCAD